MSTGTKVGGFLAGLVLIGAVGAGVGAVAGPIDTEPAGHDEGAEHETGSGSEHDESAPAEPGSAEDPHADHGEGGDTTTAPAGDAEEHGDHEGDEPATPAEAAEAVGTSATQEGYRLALDPTDDEIRFRVLDPEGEPVVETEIVHEKPLHLIVVGRDLVGYAHVHPEVDADGIWTVARPDLAPGSYRVVADLQPTSGPALVLAGDLTVPGPVTPVAVPEPAATDEVDGLTVTLDGHPQVGDTELSFDVVGLPPDQPAPVPVEPEPYLGARGHLVAFRADDLAYSHVHPHEDTSGPVRFTASFPTPGTYRLFLDLKVDGVVRTFDVTVEVDDHEH